MPDDPHRFHVRSPDGQIITGFDRPDTAKAVTLEYGEGAVVVDTLAQAYYPVVEEVANCCTPALAAGTPGRRIPRRT